MADGQISCPIEGYDDTWVKFKTSGYPFSLSRTLDKSKDTSETMRIILRYVVEWNLLDLDRAIVALPPIDSRTADILDNVDEVVTTWMIRAFYEVRAELIRSKNSLPPSPKAS